VSRPDLSASDLYDEGLSIIGGTAIGPIAIYQDDGTNRYYLASAADVLLAARIGDYSFWCAVSGDVGDPDGYTDEDDAIADALQLQLPAEVAS
jgi:hypothetical protein